ncbi:MAG: hypothetical protein PHZ26_05710 [Candidatus Gracilibacteria bacterium]|nr:hypothetical protein [Candidatus Gracilibacteria bacterium]MDD2909211.1 hypothetical protein [Candidatus Gracilibacteria bacterium]
MVALLHNHSGEDIIVRKFSFPKMRFFEQIIENNNKSAVKNIGELSDFYKIQPSNIKYNKLKREMRLLGEGLSRYYNNPVDPIVYIMKLYYSDQLAIKDIVLRLEGLGVNTNDSTMHTRMTRVFGWILRGDDDKNTLRTLKKNRVKPLIISFNKERTENIVKSKKEILDRILSKQEPFDLMKYSECTNHQERIVYIFSLHDIAKTKEEARNYIQALQKGGSSMLTISEIITDLFKNSVGDLPGISIPKLGGSEIHRMYFKDK